MPKTETAPSKKTEIHFILQGKGGVGKTFVSLMLAQYLKQKGKKVVCVDTDPVNTSFQHFKGLNVHLQEIMDKETKEINLRTFDAMMANMLETPDIEEEIAFVIDNGASSFLPLITYLSNTDTLNFLKESGHEAFIHVPLAGSGSLEDTITGLYSLFETFPDFTNFIIWQNPYWGKIEHEGKIFEEMPIYKENAQKIKAIINIPDFERKLMGADLAEMLGKHLTFDEAISSDSKLFIMTRQRLKNIQKKIFEAIDLGNIA